METQLEHNLGRVMAIHFVCHLAPRMMAISFGIDVGSTLGYSLGYTMETS